MNSQELKLQLHRKLQAIITDKSMLAFVESAISGARLDMEITAGAIRFSSPKREGQLREIAEWYLSDLQPINEAESAEYIERMATDDNEKWINGRLVHLTTTGRMIHVQ